MGALIKAGDLQLALVKGSTFALVVFAARTQWKTRNVTVATGNVDQQTKDHSLHVATHRVEFGHLKRENICHGHSGLQR